MNKEVVAFCREHGKICKICKRVFKAKLTNLTLFNNQQMNSQKNRKGREIKVLNGNLTHIVC